MPSKVVVGAQWGDEGKGKIIDILASKADVVVRSQGGNNAGHTVESGGEVYKLHLIPSGILYPKAQNLIGCGVVVDPKGLLEEIDSLEARGVACGSLRIDARAHIVMPWHIALDVCSEEARASEDIGTTRRGIGPCYMDQAERTGLRIYDIVHPEIFKKKAKAAGAAKNNILTKIYGAAPLDIDAIIDEYLAYGQRLSRYVADVSLLTFEARKAKKEILFEGAQGTLLDVNMGTYPYVTSSHPISGGVCTGVGVGPGVIDEVIGVCKAYTTRVGKGPFPTELLDELGESLRQKGNEFGTTTGRPRRVGWFDAIIARFSVRCNGLTGLVINKLDTMSGLETIKICTAYRKPDGKLINEFPSDYDELIGCEAVYEEVPGFFGDLGGCASFDELPAACKHYIKRLEDLCGCPVITVGVGPAREQSLNR